MPIEKPYDETIEIPDSEDISTPRIQKARDGTKDGQGRNRIKGDSTVNQGESASPSAVPSIPRGVGGAHVNASNKPKSSPRSKSHGVCVTASSGDDDDDEEEVEEEDDDEDEDDEEDEIVDQNTPDIIEGAYNPADYEHLVVSSEVKEMFAYIQRYTPQAIDLETHLKPFIPEYVAAVGDIDAFLKVPRPDGKPDQLGLQVLDEPCANQSDATVLDLHLRALSKRSTSKQAAVKSIDNAEQKPKAIENWVKSITDLYRAKPPPTVHYIRNMPEISNLMSEWPAAFEEAIRIAPAPGSNLDCGLNDYVDIVCAILDIPVYNNRIHSLHLLFSLYLEFKNSQHFGRTESDAVAT